jgi:hypothetical protein
MRYLICRTRHRVGLGAKVKYYAPGFSSSERITFAGTPATKLFGGTSLVTTAPAATTEFSPTITPPIMVAPVAIQTFFSMMIGFASSRH